MTVRIGVNGFGRIGRLVCARRATGRSRSSASTTSWSGDPRPPLKYDSTFGRDPGSVEVDGGARHRRAARPGDRRARSRRPRLVGRRCRHRGRVDRQVPQPRRRRAATSRPARARSCSRPRARASTRRSCSASTPTTTTRASRRGLQRVLHDELRRAMVKVLHEAFGIEQGLPHDRARLHQRPERAGRAAQGPASGPRRRGQHHPDDDRRGPRGGPGAARAGRPAGRVALRVPVVDGSLVRPRRGAGPGGDGG